MFFPEQQNQPQGRVCCERNDRSVVRRIGRPSRPDTFRELTAGKQETVAKLSFEIISEPFLIHRRKYIKPVCETMLMLRQ
jgi:hypothetical protein